MNQVNAVIRLNPKRLNFPLATLYPLLLHSYVVQIDNIPDDVTSVMLTVFKVNDSAYFNIPVARRPGTSTGYAYILPTCFPAIGSTKYEVHAYDSRGYATGLGAGLVAIGDFSDTTEPITPTTPLTVMSITDASGALHTIKAVPDGEGGYTTILDA